MENELPWYRFDRHVGHADLYVFGEIGSLKSADDLGAKLADVETINLFVDCGGGNGHTALKVVEILGGRCSVATVTGRAFSGAATLIMAAKRIQCYPDCRLMVHAAVTYCAGTAADLHSAAEGLTALEDKIVSLVSSRTKLPADTVRGWMSDGDHYFSAEQAACLGLVDEIIDRPTAALVEAVAVQAGADDEAEPTTESEKLFLDFLKAFGKVRVGDKRRFTQALSEWLVFNVDADQ